jgi:uncharacterized membrane protein YdbT with pleckstrin-like domain
MASNRLLHDEEQLVLTRRPHLKSLAVITLVSVALIAAAIAGIFYLNPSTKKYNDYLTWAGIAIPAIVTLNWLRVWTKWRFDQLLLTSQRLISRSGVFAKSVIEIPLERINNISCTQSVGERVTRSGDLVIESGGEDGKQVFANMSRPADIQREIYRQMERNQARDMDRMSTSRALSLPEQIEKLDELRQRGVVTQAEFDAKKAQLLDQM